MKKIKSISHRIALTVVCLVIWLFQLLSAQYMLSQAFFLLLRYPKSYYNNFKYEINTLVEDLKLTGDEEN